MTKRAGSARWAGSLHQRCRGARARQLTVAELTPWQVVLLLLLLLLLLSSGCYCCCRCRRCCCCCGRGCGCGCCYCYVLYYLCWLVCLLVLGLTPLVCVVRCIRSRQRVIPISSKLVLCMVSSLAINKHPLEGRVHPSRKSISLAG